MDAQKLVVVQSEVGRLGLDPGYGYLSLYGKLEKKHEYGVLTFGSIDSFHIG